MNQRRKEQLMSETKTEMPFNPEASIASAAAAESAEIINLLDEATETTEASGGCCGGACCSA